jgi:hypothetical protein
MAGSTASIHFLLADFFAKLRMAKHREYFASFFGVIVFVHIVILLFHGLFVYAASTR